MDGCPFVVGTRDVGRRLARHAAPWAQALRPYRNKPPAPIRPARPPFVPSSPGGAYRGMDDCTAHALNWTESPFPGNAYEAACRSNRFRADPALNHST